MNHWLKKLSVLIALSLVLSVVPLTNSFAKESKDNNKEVEVLVVYKDNASKQQSLSAANVKNAEVMSTLPIAVLKVPANQVEKLKKDPNVKSVSFNEKAKLIGNTPALKSYKNRPVDEQFFNLEMVNIFTAWDKGYTGKNVKVGVIDTGFDVHPDLKLAGGKSFIDGKDYTVDDLGHGTHVAGTIGALRNGFGAAGVAPDAKIYGLKVFDDEDIAYYSDMIKALDWAIANKLDVVNMSVGGPYSAAFEEAVKRATKAGVLIVAAAGNDWGGPVNYPAAYDDVISVASVDEYKNRSYFSNIGKENELAAPGEYIYSTYPDDDYEYLQGTSMATPHVVGLLAVLKQKFPKYNAAQLRYYLNASAEDLGEKGRDTSYGYGLARYLEPTPLKSFKVSIKNNYGKDDQITFSGIEVGKTYTIFKDTQFKTKLKSFKATKTPQTVSVKQLGAGKGSVYVSVQQAGYGPSALKTVNYSAEKLPALTSKNVTVKNNKGSNDKITFKGIVKGATYTIYSDKKLRKKLKSFTAKSTSQTVSVKQVGKKDGTLYIVAKKTGYLSSSTAKIKFEGEPTNALSAKNITIKKAKKGYTIKFKGLKKGTKVVIYKDKQKKKKLYSFTAKKSSKTITIKKLTKKDKKIYITVEAKSYGESKVTEKKLSK